MLKALKDFWNEEDGLGTVEIVIIVAVLAGIALIFRTAMFNWIGVLIERMTDSANEAVAKVTTN